MAGGLLLTLVLAALALSLSATVLGQVNGGCHGHHYPMPMPSHTCCYARPQPAAPIQISPSATAPQAVAGDAMPPEVNSACIALVVSSHMSLSLPPQRVLRI